MTYEERTNIESYFENINNLISLKEALDRSLMHTTSEIDFAMSWLDEQYEEAELTLHNSYNKSYSDQYTKTMKRVLENILPCWKLVNKKK
jgi:uncharacterized alpha-E superfamily protein